MLFVIVPGFFVCPNVEGILNAPIGSCPSLRASLPIYIVDPAGAAHIERRITKTHDVRATSLLALCTHPHTHVHYFAFTCSALAQQPTIAPAQTSARHGPKARQPPAPGPAPARSHHHPHARITPVAHPPTLTVLGVVELTLAICSASCTHKHAGHHPYAHITARSHTRPHLPAQLACSPVPGVTAERKRV